MSEALKPIQPVRRVRRIAGSILVGLGVVVGAVALRAFVARGPMFDYADWLRFWVLFWTSPVFVLTGFWLRSRSRAAFWSAVLVFVGEIAFLAWFDYWVRHFAPPPQALNSENRKSYVPLAAPSA